MGFHACAFWQLASALAHTPTAARDKDYANAHYNLAVVLLQLGRRDEAVVHLIEAVRLRPNDLEAKAQLRQLGVEK